MAVSKHQAWAGVTAATRRSMIGNTSKNTKPEVALRRALHAEGYRFRIHDKRLPGTPDLAFTKRHIAIQVHGCFWHRHEDCRLANTPKGRDEYWPAKLARTVQRDIQNETALQDLGWRQITVWECELRKGTGKLIEQLKIQLGPPRI